MRAARPVAAARAAAALGAAALLAASCASPPPVPRAAGGPCTLAILIRGLDPTPGSGPVVVAVWSSASTFMRRGQAFESCRVAPDRVGEELRLDGLPEGTYAVSAYHDRSSAGELRRSAFGMPVDPWAVSGGAAPLVPPSWKRAAFEVRPGRNDVVLEFVPGAGSGPTAGR